MNRETTIMHQIMLALSEAGCLVFRNEVAGAWVGRVIHKDSQHATLAGARIITFGVGGKGGSDLVGITPDGRFLAVEVKTPTGRATAEQKTFIDAVNRAGGVAGVAQSPTEALDLIKHKQ